MTDRRRERPPIEWARGDPADFAIAHADPIALFVDIIENRRPSWHRDAECRASDVDFTSKVDTDRARAFDLCGRCVVRDECRRWSLTIRDDHAVLGGLDPAARRRLINRKIAEAR